MASLKVNNEALQEVAGKLEKLEKLELEKLEKLEKQVVDFERINEKLELKIESLQTDKRVLE